MSPLLVTAISMATALHRHQRRCNGDAYIAHPLAVLRILQKAGVTSVSILAAAVLHDVLEATLSLEQMRICLRAITRVFGPDTAAMVRTLTKEPTHYLYPQPLREQRYVSRLELHSVRHPGVLLIKLADRLHNIQTIGGLPENRRKRVLAETADTYIPLFTRNVLSVPKFLCGPYVQLARELQVSVLRIPKPSHV